MKVNRSKIDNPCLFFGCAMGQICKKIGVFTTHCFTNFRKKVLLDDIISFRFWLYIQRDS